MIGDPERLTFKEQIKGFPFGQIFVISLIRLAEPIAFTSLFPYVYFMIRDLGVCKDDAEISEYTGYLASTFSFFQALSAIFWGNASDKYGRKPVLMAGLFGCSMSLLLFGFSRNFAMAFFSRSLMGLLNGNSAVVRCVIGEIAPNKRHHTLAYLVMPVAWNIGNIFGPLIGGNLATPIQEIKSLEKVQHSSLFKVFPYALPNIVIALLMLMGIIVAYLFLEETHPELKDRHDKGIALGNRMLGVFGIAYERPRNSKDDPESFGESSLLIVSPSARLESGNLKQALFNFKTLNPIISYLIMQAHFVVFNEFLPVFACFDAAYNYDGTRASQFPLKLVGGLGYTSQKAGKLLSSSGFFGIVMMLALFPWMDRTFKPISFFRFALGTFPIIFCVLPYCLLLLPLKQSQFEHHGTPNADTFLYVFVLVRVIFASSLGTTVMVRINDNAPAESVGIVNGLAISASAMAGCFGPLIWGKLMTLSQKLDFAWLSWWCLSLLTFIGFIQGFFIQ